jgi:hypothetical protein
MQKVWDQQKPPCEEIEMEVPKFNGQVDYLREQIRDRKIQEYINCIDHCLGEI